MATVISCRHCGAELAGGFDFASGRTLTTGQGSCFSCFKSGTDQVYDTVVNQETPLHALLVIAAGALEDRRAKFALGDKPSPEEIGAAIDYFAAKYEVWEAKNE